MKGGPALYVVRDAAMSITRLEITLRLRLRPPEDGHRPKR